MPFNCINYAFLVNIFMLIIILMAICGRHVQSATITTTTTNTSNSNNTIANITTAIKETMLNNINSTDNRKNSNESDTTFEFILLHNNDMHGRFDETDEYTNQCEDEDKKLNKCYGGFARVANV